MEPISLVIGAISVALALFHLSAVGRRMVVRRYTNGRTISRNLIVTYWIYGVVAVATGLIWNFYPYQPIIALGVFTIILGITVVVLLRNRISPQPVAAKRRVLAIGAHPDDLELACGGTLARLADHGHEVHALVMTHGAVGGDASVRPDEARRGAAFMGLDSITVHDLPDTGLPLVGNEMIKRIEAAIEQVQPHIILTHSAHDQHQDHHAVHQATLRAARSQHSILCYESPSVTREFDPDVFVDVTGYTDIKVESVMAHRNQAGKPYMTEDTVKGITRFRGRQAKGEHAEGFESVRLMMTDAGVL